MERENNFIKTWLRPSPNEFNITYNNGKKYEFDFFVETKSNIFIVEVKADKDLDDADVLAKRKELYHIVNLYQVGNAIMK